MGCDIHAWVECRVDGKWTFRGKWEFSGRSYDLFAALANVRNSGGVEPILPAVSEDGEVFDHKRGWPVDASPRVLQMKEDEDIDHSPSWLTLAELESYSWEKNELEWFKTDGYVRSLSEPGVSPEDIRIVFYFDS